MKQLSIRRKTSLILFLGGVPFAEMDLCFPLTPSSSAFSPYLQKRHQRHRLARGLLLCPLQPEAAPGSH